MVSNSFICVSITSQVLWPRYITLSEPWLTVLIVGTSKSVHFLRLYWHWCLSVNILFIIAGEMSWYIFYISISRALWFLSWIEDDDDDDDDDDKLFLRNGWPTKRVWALFPAGTIVRDSDHHKSPIRHKQGLNLRRIWVQTFVELSYAMVISTTSRYTEVSFSSNFSKKNFLSLYIVNEDIFHEAYLLCYFLCNYEASKLTGNIWIVTWKTHWVTIPSH